VHRVFVAYTDLLYLPNVITGKRFQWIVDKVYFTLVTYSGYWVHRTC